MILEQFLEDKGIVPKKKEKPSKAFQTLSTAGKWTLVEALLRDLGYID